jgi:cell division protein ZapA (FtsZ GTPase activity inhibitor)
MKVQIAIRGRRYTLKSDEGDVDLTAVARYVDQRMSEIASRPGSLDEYTIAMLAALNIASDFERYRREVDAHLGDVERELASAAVLLGEGLAPDAPVEDES